VKRIETLDIEYGEVITFYSYKGGTGRTMALSNVACILARQSSKSKGVLMIDWDLEAPGLHRFFFQEEVKDEPGLIDLFLELDAATTHTTTDGSDLKESVALAINALDRVKLENYVIKTNISNLSLLKAGRFDQTYSDKVNTFNWERLYNRTPALIRVFAERLTERYKYVLIDSRTGYTDISGICTALMPQKLVFVFTPNRQSYTGIKPLIERATRYRLRSPDFRPLLVYPLPSRIEFSRDDLRAYWRSGKDIPKIDGYQPMFENIFKEVYGLSMCDLTEYFDEVQIQQSPNYAYGEKIAILTEKTRDNFSISRSYEILTRWLIDSIEPWQPQEQRVTSSSSQVTSIKYACYISYARSAQGKLMDVFLRNLTTALDDYLGAFMDEGIYFDKERLSPGYDYQRTLAQAICQSVCMIVVYTSLYANTPYCLQEFLAMEQIEKKRRDVIRTVLGRNTDRSMIIPIVIKGDRDEDLPPKIKGIHYLDLSKFFLQGNASRRPIFRKVIQEIAEDIYSSYRYLKEMERNGHGRQDCDNFDFPSVEEASISWGKKKGPLADFPI